MIIRFDFSALSLWNRFKCAVFVLLGRKFECSKCSASQLGERP